MKKIITLLSLTFCLLFVVACGDEAETTSSSEAETTASSEAETATRDDSFYQYSDVEMYDIETSVVTLKYPAKWKDVVKTEVTDDGVKFSNEGVELFSVMFVESDISYYLGTYNGTPIYLDIPEDKLTDEQQEMKKDINAIIENIERDSNFSK